MDAEMIEKLRKLAEWQNDSRNARTLRQAADRLAALSATPQAAQPEPEDVLGWLDESCIPSVRAGDAVVIRGTRPEDGRRYTPVTLATPQAAQVPEGYTTGHCEHRRRGPGGCPFPNLQCGYPDCDRRPLAAANKENNNG